MEDKVPVTKIVPWLYCANLKESLAFYRDVLGFSLRGARAEERSAYLEYSGGRIMLQELPSDALLAGKLEHPYGRGIHLLIETPDVDALALSASESCTTIFVKPRNRWYQVGEDMEGHREVVFQDPDGYLVRCYQRLEGLEDA